jgi:hypothetical protein
MLSPLGITIILAVVTGLVLIIFLVLVWLVRKHLKLRDDYEDLSEIAHNLNNEVRELSSLLPLIDERIAATLEGSNQLAERMNGLTEKLNTFHVQQSESSNHPYGQAIQKVRSGASVNELMQSSGLSQDEAALLIRLHGAKTR